MARDFIGANLVLYTRVRDEVVLDLPIALGISVLENAKLLMYSYYYEVVKRVWGSRVRMLYTGVCVCV